MRMRNIIVPRCINDAESNSHALHQKLCASQEAHGRMWSNTPTYAVPPHACDHEVWKAYIRIWSPCTYNTMSKPRNLPVRAQNANVHYYYNSLNNELPIVLICLSNGWSRRFLRLAANVSGRSNGRPKHLPHP